MHAKEFTKKFIYLLIPFIIFLLVFYSVLFKRGYFPVITNSASLDAKMLDYRAHNFNNIDVLSVGSSMNLNNINSTEIKLPKGLTTYYNFGAWGLQISDTFYFVKYFTDKYKIKCVVISSSIPDFTAKAEQSIPKYYELDIINKFLPYYYSQSGMLSILYRHQLLKQYKAATDDYTNLNFDEFGGVALTIPKKKISSTRWNEMPTFPNKNTSYQYNALKDLALFLKNKRIVFIYAQAPMRSALANAIETKAIINDHFKKCKSIVAENGGIYLNLHSTSIYDDSLFVDQYHLTSEGSKIYTKQISAKINNIF